MKTKKQQSIDFFLEGNFRESFKLAQAFKREFSSEQLKIIGRAYGCLSNPDFYIQLDRNIEEDIDVAKKIYQQEIIINKK